MLKFFQGTMLLLADQWSLNSETKGRSEHTVVMADVGSNKYGDGREKPPKCTHAIQFRH